MKNNLPIGVFDSGVGGLTVANAIKYIMPNESIIYFGDTAHLPYGDKSAESIIHYSKRIADFLLEKGIKVLLIACNSASASAYNEIVEYVGKRAKVINVIDPVIQYITNEEGFENIGVIGTKRTIDSKTYELKIKDKKPDINVKSVATPLFVPMIEEGFIYDDISNAIIRSYLSNEKIINLDSLILGCTHYPIIKNQIRKFYNFQVEIIDSSRIVAHYVKNYLKENSLENTEQQFSYDFFVSDYTPTFETIAEMFFEQKIYLEKINLWN